MQRIRRARALTIESLERRSLLTTVIDVDGDGDLDAVGNDAWQENYDGYGNFVPHPFAATPDSVVLAADFDGDGDPDLALSDAWLENDGAGGFAERHALPVIDGFVATSALLRDLGGDGDLDVVFRSGDRSITLENSDGQGTFRIASDFTIEDVADLGDIDNDGRLDALKIENGGIWVYRYHAEGGFDRELWYQEPELEDGEQFVVWRVQLADFDNDRWLDIVTESYFEDRGVVRIHWNDGTGGLLDEPHPMHYSYGGLSAEIHDFDQNGALDLLAWEDACDWRSIYLNDGSGILHLDQYINICDANVIGWGDFDGNGSLDILMSDMRWSGTVLPPPEPSARVYTVDTLRRADGNIDAIRSLAFADLMGDDELEIIVAGDYALHVFQHGIAQSVVETPESDRVLRFGFGDLDDDGDTDLAFATASGTYRVDNVGGELAAEAVKITRPGNLWNTIENQLVDNPANPSPPQTIVRGDVTGDGQADLVEWSQGILTVRDAASDLRYVLAWNVGLAALADMDYDGDLDILYVRFSEEVLSWLENADGQGSFVETHRLGNVGYFAFAIPSVDIDQDGRQDLVVVSSVQITIFQSRVTGDGNRDGRFDSQDLIEVLARGEYEDGVYRNSAFDSGDWNGDGEFDTRDLMFALQAGTYQP